MNKLFQKIFNRVYLQPYQMAVGRFEIYTRDDVENYMIFVNLYINDKIYNLGYNLDTNQIIIEYVHKKKLLDKKNYLISHDFNRILQCLEKNSKRVILKINQNKSKNYHSDVVFEKIKVSLTNEPKFIKDLQFIEKTYEHHKMLVGLPIHNPTISIGGNDQENRISASGTPISNYHADLHNPKDGTSSNSRIPTLDETELE
jgi:hypothetical protein